MSEENQRPPIIGYDLSTDYNALWDLIGNGYRVPAWIQNKDYSHLWDIIEVKRNRYGDLLMGVRGIGYEPLDRSKEGFVSTCKSLNIYFVIPKLESNE